MQFAPCGSIYRPGTNPGIERVGQRHLELRE
jgi:hypothetical protein